MKIDYSAELEELIIKCDLEGYILCVMRVYREAFFEMRLTPNKDIELLTLLLTVFLCTVHGDYKCICNYNLQKTVYTKSSDTSPMLGYIYEYDCKEIVLSQQQSTEWFPIAFQHQVGYIQKDNNIDVELCPGDPFKDDQVTTTKSAQSVTTTKPQTTTSTTTQAPTTSTTTQAPTTSTTTQAPTTSTTTQAPTTSTTTQAPTTSTTTHAPTTSTTTQAPTTTQTPTTSTTTQAPTTSTTTQAPTTSTTTQAPTTSTTTQPPTTSSTTQSPTTSKTLQCPSSVLHAAHGQHDNFFIDENNRKCFQIMTTHKNWFNAESICKENGGHLATITSQTQSSLLHTYAHAYGHKVWIGLNDIDNEGHFKWSSGEPLTYQYWSFTSHHYPLAHFYEDCVVMEPDFGIWKDASCLENNAYFCEYAAVYSAGSSLQTTHTSMDGNIDLCHRGNVEHSTSHSGHFLGQYGKSCYEIITSNKVSFDQGEQICQLHGGHLAHITNAQEQEFIESFMNRHYPDHAVWIGLTDKEYERYFKWTSGNSVTYINWKPGHENNFDNHHNEDCVVFIPYEHGKWDDVKCGQNDGMNNGHYFCSGECYPILCQYGLHSSHHSHGYPHYIG
ncbi:hypothetical protein ACF0H5_019683 [Mactra antiquata]